jgi:hypothetical protein
MGSELVTDSGGKASVYFDGGDTLDNNTLAGQNRLDSYTIQDTSDTTYVIPSSATSGSHYGIYANNDTSSSAGSYAGSASFGTPNVYKNGAVFSTSTLNDVHDGLTGKSNLLTMEGASTSVWTSFTVGHYHNNSAPSFNYTGKISEMVFFPNMNSSQKRFPIEQNMLRHFDVPHFSLDFEGFTTTEMSNNSVMGPSGNSTIGTATLSEETSNPISGTKSMKIVHTSGNNGSYPRFYLSSLAKLPTNVAVGEKYRLTFDTKLISGNTEIVNISFRDGSDTPPSFLKFADDNLVLTTETQTHTYETTVTDVTSVTNTIFWSIKGSTTAGTFLIDNIKVEKIGFTGFVTTLYDQTGNNCHALQSTAAYQPQIVSGGDLIKSGNHPAWEYPTGNPQRNLNIQGLGGLSTLDAFFVQDIDTAETIYTYPTAPNSDLHKGFVVQSGSASSAMQYNYGSAVLEVNGTEQSPSSRGDLHGMLDGRILAYHRSGATTGWDSVNVGHSQAGSNQTTNIENGKFSEMIWYDSDQHSNQSGIESNITNHYF